MRSQVSIAKCKSYNRSEVEEAVRKSIGLLGGITSFVKSTDKVLIKPNLLSAATPDLAIDTHPEFVRAVVRLVKDTGAKIFLGDSPSVCGEPEDIDNVYEVSGIKKVAEEEGVELVRFDRRVMKSDYLFTSWIDDCNCIISLPKFKTHQLTMLTGAIKNLFGLIPGLYKIELHKRALSVQELSKILVDIYSIVKPRLSIVDGIVSMEGDGPDKKGRAKNLGLVLASSDAVALDSILAVIMGINPKDVFSTKEASGRNLGNADLDNIDIFGEKIEDVMPRDYKLPQTSIINRLPRPLLNIGRLLFNFKPSIDGFICTTCGMCQKACPASAIAIENNKTKIDYSKCVACFCCKEVCPQGAISVKKSLVAKIARF